MRTQRFENVWDAIEDTPGSAENMKLRSTLMAALKAHLIRRDLSPAQAAKLFGVTQPRVSDLMRGKINLFGLDALVNMATAAGLQIELRVLEAPGPSQRAGNSARRNGLRNSSMLSCEHESMQP